MTRRAVDVPASRLQQVQLPADGVRNSNRSRMCVQAAYWAPPGQGPPRSGERCPGSGWWTAIGWPGEAGAATQATAGAGGGGRLR